MHRTGRPDLVKETGVLNDLDTDLSYSILYPDREDILQYRFVINQLCIANHLTREPIFTVLWAICRQQGRIPAYASFIRANGLIDSKAT